MTIGTTTTFTQTRDEICTDALINLGAVAPGKSASDARTAPLLIHAARALNRVVKSIDADGEFLWRVVRRTDATTGTGENFWFPAIDVIDIDEPMTVTRLGETTETPMVPISRDEWMLIPDKTVRGLPNRYFVETESSTGQLTVNVFPTIDANGMGFSYAAVIRAADFNSGAETPDFVSQWISCLVYGLTAELAAAYGQPNKISAFRQLFTEEKTRLLSDGSERGNLRLVPFGRGSY